MGNERQEAEDVFTFLENRAKARRVKDSSGNWLVLDLDARERILQYQVEMIRHNHGLRVLPVYKRQVNDRIELWYDVGETLPLTDWLGMGNITREGLLDVLDSIISFLTGCKNYFLHDRCLLLDINNVFIHPRSLAVFLIYLPLPLGGDAERNFRQFLRQLQAYWQPERSGENLRLHRTILELCEIKTASLEEMARTLKNCRYSYIGRRGQKSGSDQKPFRLDPDRSNEANDSPPDVRREKKALLAGLKAFCYVIVLEAVAVALIPALAGPGRTGSSPSSRLAVGILFTVFNIFLLGVIFRYVAEKTGQGDKPEQDVPGWRDVLLRRMAGDKAVLRKAMESAQEITKKSGPKP